MIVVKYIIFAAISMLCNLLVQYLSLLTYSRFAALYVAMFFGTLAGLVVKYVLDKNYIFYHTPKNKKDDVTKFMHYSLMGIITTGIFWGTEIAFDALFQRPNAKFVGAMIGLSVGYVVKYFLDRKYVFIEKEDVLL